MQGNGNSKFILNKILLKKEDSLDKAMARMESMNQYSQDSDPGAAPSTGPEVQY